MPDVFISYCHKDIQAAEAMERRLAANCLDVWLDKSRLLGGMHYPSQLQRALDETKCLVALISENSIESDWVAAEVETAKDRTIPCFIDACILPLTFRALIGRRQHIDMRPWIKAGDDRCWAMLMDSIHTAINASRSGDTRPGRQAPTDNASPPVDHVVPTVRRVENTTIYAGNTINGIAGNVAGNVTIIVPKSGQ